MKNLDNITLCVVDCKNHQNAAKSIIYCSSLNEIKFGKKIYLSDIKHYKLDSNKIDFVKIETISSPRQYDNFIIKNLHQYIDTDFLLIVQHDGMIYNPSNWTDEFLNYDYIGAAWPSPPKNGCRVGNGGFSLRSTKFMKECSNILGDQYCNEAEDVYCSCTIHKIMIEKGFKYAPVELAKKFSYEQYFDNISEDTFGFHLASTFPCETHLNFRKKIYENIHKNW